MRVDGFASICVFGLLLTAPVRAAERGVVVEEVGVGSALEKAGGRAGDVFYTWDRLPSPPANPEGAKGELGSYFDWRELSLEQAPRGTVVLQGEREGDALRIEVEPGEWKAQVRPQLPEAVLRTYTAAAPVAWKELANAPAIDTSTRDWLWLRIGESLSAARRWESAAEAYRNLLDLASDGPVRIAALELLGQTYRSARDLKRAREAFDSAIGLRRRSEGEGLGVANDIFQLGALAWMRRDLELAGEHFRRALDIREKLAPESLDHALSLNSLAILTRTRADLDAAESYNRQALKVREKLAPGSLDHADSLHNLGNVIYSRGRIEEASALFERALQIREKVDARSRSVAQSLNNLGIVARSRGELDKAAMLLSRALEIEQELDPGGLGVGNGLSNLATVYWSRGEISLAQEYMERGLRIREQRIPESMETAMSLFNLGSVAVRREQPEIARRYYERALGIREKTAPESEDVALSLHSLAVLAAMYDELDHAAELQRRALVIRQKKAPHSLGVAASMNHLGLIARKRGHLDEALEYFERALVIREDLGPESLGVAATRFYLGEIARDRGDFKLAREHYASALRIDKRLAPGGLHEALVLHTLGQLALDMSQNERARKYFLESLETLETHLSQLGGPRDAQAGVRARHEYLYHDAILFLFKSGSYAEAFHVVERSRARSFLAILAERDLVFAQDAPQELDRERRRLKVLYDQAQQELFELRPRSEPTQLEELLAELHQLRHRYEEVIDEIRRTSPKLASLRYPEPLDLDGVRAVLDPGTVLLSYSVGESETHLFVLSLDAELHALELPIGEEELRDKIGFFRNLIAQARPDTRLGRRRLEDLDHEARELYKTLLEPVGDEIERGERLLILPDGLLHQLPWSALVRPLSENGDGQYLVEWKPHHVALSATVYAELRRERPRGVASGTAFLTAFGDPVYPPRFADAGAEIPDVRVRAAAARGFGFEPLPGTRREVESIAALYGDRAAVFLGADATEERAKSTDDGTRYLHFATHGLLDERFPLNSGIALTIPDELGEGRDNGLLQAWEIFESVRLDADLVVLSACESALGQELGGEGLVGLTRAFQYAGARSVLASLWQVADESTAVLMERFYRHLEAGKSKDEALRAAQLELLSGPVTVVGVDSASHELDASAPYAWAAFQLHGDWR